MSKARRAGAPVTEIEISPAMRKAGAERLCRSGYLESEVLTADCWEAQELAAEVFQAMLVTLK